MSNTTEIENTLKDLILKDDKEFVAMLSGEWGIGKTYFWRDIFVPKYLKQKDVVYISLFGANSLKDIEAKILLKLSSFNQFKKKYEKFLSPFKKTISLLSSSSGYPIDIASGTILSLFSPNDFKNIIICFDDFERLSDKVSLKDVIGLISQFKEQKECKVIMILNEGELSKSNQEIFSKNKEKIVDYNFHYHPSQEELFAAISEDIKNIKFCDSQTIYAFFKKIGLKNIRIMKQSLYLLEKFSFIESEDYDKKVIDEFVKIALNLFVFKAKSNYTYSEFDNFRSYTPYDNQVYNAKIYNDKETEVIKNEKHESNLKYYYSDNQRFSQEYHSTNKDIIERNIYNFIDSHILDDTELKIQLDENNKSLDYYVKRNEISKLYERLWTDFTSTNKEIAEELFNILNKHKDDMHRLFHYSNYKPFIEKINEFASNISTEALETDIAKKCLDFYIVSPDHDKYGPLEDSSETDLIILHYPWAEEYKNEKKMAILTIKPNDALELIEDIVQTKYLSEENIYKLKQISANNYENLIKENSDFILPLIKFLKMPDSKDVRTNIINALKSLKGESKDYAWKVNQIVTRANIDLEKDK